MKILIANDDGINAPGLLKLAKWAQKLGEIMVVAPKYEQSAKSQSIDIRNAFEAAPNPIEALPGVEAWAVDSTPADCVRWALRGLEYDADIVFTGINDGFNLGSDILYSATAGAAAEAVFFGKKSVAFSSGKKHLPFVGEEALDYVWKYFEDNRLLEAGGFWNVNIPREYSGIRLTRQGGHFYRDYFEPLGENMVRQVGMWVFENQHDQHVDTDAVTDGFVSVCPLTVARTDFDVYGKLADRLNR